MRVLVVEDEDAIADFLVRGLREEGFVVERAADALAAAARLSAAEWDVVLLDRRLPGGDGIEVLRQYRARGGMAATLILTARDAVADRVAGLDAGADDYLCKPFAFEELAARVRALARRERRPPIPNIAAAGVSIDLPTQRAERNGVSLALTAREQALLAFFLRHPQQVLTRTRLYDQVWGDRYDGGSNTLEVHVMALRRALEAHGPRLIHTMRGRGYMFGMAPEEL